MDILQKIGLTKKEAEIYERLLQLGECSISSLQKSLGIHPQIVYRGIDSLLEKGLVLSVLRKGKKWVSAEHPRKLEDLQEDRMSQLKKAIPQLVQLMTPKKSMLVKTSVGADAIRAFRRKAINELSRNNTLYVIGASGDRFYEVMGTHNDEIERKRIKKKINKKILAFPSEKSKFSKDPHKLFTDFRFLRADQATASSINIFGDTVGIIIWASEPILLEMKSYEVALSHKHYFNEVWSTATTN